jgi:hypothetical protein
MEYGNGSVRGPAPDLDGKAVASRSRIAAILAVVEVHEGCFMECYCMVFGRP